MALPNPQTKFVEALRHLAPKLGLSVRKVAACLMCSADATSGIVAEGFGGVSNLGKYTDGHRQLDQVSSGPAPSRPGFNASDTAAEEAGREPPELSTLLIHTNRRGSEFSRKRTIVKSRAQTAEQTVGRAKARRGASRWPKPTTPKGVKEVARRRSF